MSAAFKFRSNAPEVRAQIKRGLQANLKAAAMLWHGGVIDDQLTGTRSGRTYRVPGTGSKEKKPIVIKPKHPRYKVSSFIRRAPVISGGVMYKASRPGEPPASRLGDLRISYKYRVKGLAAEIGSPLPYALALEKGTSKMAPRPHLMRGFNSRRTEIMAALNKEVI